MPEKNIARVFLEGFAKNVSYTGFRTQTISSINRVIFLRSSLSRIRPNRSAAAEGKCALIAISITVQLSFANLESKLKNGSTSTELLALSTF